jgi:peroxiredoxin
MRTRKSCANGSRRASRAITTLPFSKTEDHKVIDRYGLFNPDGRGWPHPTTYVIDKQGIVRWKFTEVDYRKRPSNEQILAEIGKLK